MAGSTTKSRVLWKSMMTPVAAVAFIAASVCGAHPRFENTPLYKHLIVPEAQSDQQEQPAQRQEEPISEEPEEEAAQREYRITREPARTLTGLAKRQKYNPPFTADTPFYEAVNILKNSTRRPLNIVVNWKDLEQNAGIDRYTPIGVEPGPGASVKGILRLMLSSVSSAGERKIDYVVRDGIIHIGTEESLPKMVETRVYDAGDLLIGPPNPFPGGMGYPMPYGRMGPYGGMMGRGRGMRPYGNYGMAYRGIGQDLYVSPFGGFALRTMYTPGLMTIPSGVGLSAGGGFFGNVQRTVIPGPYTIAIRKNKWTRQDETAEDSTNPQQDSANPGKSQE